MFVVCLYLLETVDILHSSVKQADNIIISSFTFFSLIIKTKKIHFVNDVSPKGLGALEM